MEVQLTNTNDTQAKVHTWHWIWTLLHRFHSWALYKAMSHVELAKCEKVPRAIRSWMHSRIKRAHAKLFFCFLVAKQLTLAVDWRLTGPEPHRTRARDATLSGGGVGRVERARARLHRKERRGLWNNEEFTNHHKCTELSFIRLITHGDTRGVIEEIFRHVEGTLQPSCH